MLSKMVSLAKPVLLLAVLAPRGVLADVPPCIAGAVHAALNPSASSTACEHMDHVSSNLHVICGTKVTMAMSVFSAICRNLGTPPANSRENNTTTVLPAMITITTAISTATYEVAPVPMTTMLVPIKTRTYTVSSPASLAMNSSQVAMTTAYPTAPVVGGSGVNATTTVTRAASEGAVSGIVVPAAATTAAPAVSSRASSAPAALATGDMGLLALVLGAGLLAA